MHQREIDRAAGNAIGGTIAGLFIVFALVARYPRQSLFLGAIVAIVVGVVSAYSAWHSSLKPEALKWPGYDLTILDSEQGRKDTAMFREALGVEPSYFKRLQAREFLIRFLPTIRSAEYKQLMRCEALFYTPGEAKPYAVLQTEWDNSVCNTEMSQPALGHWKNGVWRIASLGKPLNEFQIDQLAQLVGESTPGDPVYSVQKRSYSPWLRAMQKARWSRDWITFYEGKDWISVVF